MYIFSIKSNEISLFNIDIRTVINIYYILSANVVCMQIITISAKYTIQRMLYVFVIFSHNVRNIYIDI